MRHPLASGPSLAYREVRMSIAAFLIFLLPVARSFAAPGLPLSVAPVEPASLVDPFIGTAYGGNTYPGAQVPWGMVSVSPHNDLSAPSGYIQGRDYIYGFGHVHVSGTGCPDLGNILVMATTGKIRTAEEEYKSRYEDEEAAPGYYRVALRSYDVTAEATATVRAGLLRFAFPPCKGDANIIFDMSHRLPPDRSDNPSPFLGRARILSPSECEGWSESGNFRGTGNRQKVFFFARFSKPADETGTWSDAKTGQAPEASGKDAGAFFRFTTIRGESILVKAGVSYVSPENARRNVEKEVPGWTFSAVRRAAASAWNTELGAITVTGGTAGRQTVFYTALYHTLIHPSVFSDVNGEYQGYRGAGVKRAQDRIRYHVFSLWDTYRTLHPLLTLAYPGRQVEMVASMLGMASEGGWLPKWELAGNETYVMAGDPAVAVIADTYTRGLTGFDANAAYAAMMKGAALADNNPLRPGIKSFLKYGYIPEDDPGEARVWGTVSTLLEYAVADWSMGQMAKALGKEADCQAFQKRAACWRYHFDPATGFLRARMKDGAWFSPFDPEAITTPGRGDWSGGPGYVEGNAWHYTFFVPQDVPGLISAFGGAGGADADAFVDKLAACFDTGNFTLQNEPDFGHPYLFTFVDAEAWRTQRLVRENLARSFRTGPGGLPGNDDAGATSGWAVFSSIGFYPLTPGSGEYRIGSPAFDTATIRLDPAHYPGKTFTVRAVNNSFANQFIQSATLNGRPLAVPVLKHADVVRGGTLELVMGPKPSAWGGTPRPPKITRQPGDISVEEGRPAEFSVGVSGTGPMSYAWKKGGVPVPGASGATFTVPAAPLSADGVVLSCEVSSAFGREESRAAALKVRPDRIPPQLLSAVLVTGSATSILVSFSEPVSIASAVDPTRYTLYPRITVRDVKRSEDGRHVVLTTASPLNSRTQYRLSVDGVADGAEARNETAPGSRVDVLPGGDGLFGTYFATMDLTGPGTTRVDPMIDFDWGQGSPAPGIKPDRFSVRWTGKVRPDSSEVYTFTTTTGDNVRQSRTSASSAGDGVRLWVDNRLLIDRWKDTHVTENSGTIFLSAGRQYPVWMEYYENTYSAVARLSWSSPSIPQSVIPQISLYSDKKK